MVKFSNLQISAIIRAGIVLSEIDGKTDSSEAAVMAATLFGFVGCNESEYKSIMSSVESMNEDVMLSILSSMNEEQKKFVCGFLSTIIIADGKIDDSEIRMWRVFTTLARLPQMSIQEAGKYFK